MTPAPRDPRHPLTQQADMDLWLTFLGGVSPAAQAEAFTESRPHYQADAEKIATELWANFPDTDGYERDEAVASLARTLRYEGGAV